MSDKMRVHILAKELNVPSKAIIDKCQAEGISNVKNHMSTLSAGLHATILEWFSEGSHDVAVETAKRVDLSKLRTRSSRSKTKKSKETPDEVLPSEDSIPDEGQVASDSQDELVREVEVHAVAEPKTVPVAAPAPPPAVVIAGAPESKTAKGAPAPEIGQAPEVSPVVEAKPVETPQRGLEEGGGEPKVAASAPSAPQAAPVMPAGPRHVPAPAKLTGPRVVRYEAPNHEVRPPMRTARGRDARGPATPTGPEVPAARVGERGADTGQRGRAHPRRGGRIAEGSGRVGEWRNQDLLERQERLEGATGRRLLRRRPVASSGGGSAAATGPKTMATVREPIRMKEFCAETGLSFVQLFKVLRDEFQVLPNINMILPTETAQLLGLRFGIELTVVAAKTRLDDLEEESNKRSRVNLQPRPPVVTMLGHVDHGKTSLLDAIRKTRVVAGEDGGITQHISSYHIQSPRGAVTFLDTPGHEAFAEMRARGAKMTDVVVLVVAADDGVMPQTVEAIRHAQAAGVPIVVALNKIDLGEQNKLKIYGQLSEHQLAPTEWGGEVDVLATSATQNRGITELIDHLAELSGVLDLKADPTLPATGTVIEAETRTGVGPVVRVLVQEGTLRVGAFVVCGSAAGKVRALIGDLGQRIDEAGPSIPVEVWGLDCVPAAGDKLYEVESLQRAKGVAGEAAQLRLASDRHQTRRMRTLQEMLQRRDAAVVPELNVIIKADVDGSLAALRQTLSEIPSDEVRLTIRHSAVGPVNDSDILLAATCAGLVIAFRVDVSAGARRLSDMHGVEVRSYRVIYEVHDEIKKALEGLLSPDEHVETRATAEVRELFRLGRKAGVVAGSYVTNGTLERGHEIKVIRNGVVVREGARFASLRRFKDDVKEVRAGMECGIRLEGFDDVHVGDVIETYEIIKTARTL